jgi:hypothetical protein
VKEAYRVLKNSGFTVWSVQVFPEKFFREYNIVFRKYSTWDYEEDGNVYAKTEVTLVTKKEA